jgi:hypothetical protein
MKGLSENLKQMMNALALQDAADYLPMSQKLEMLGVGGGRPGGARARVEPAVAPAPRRVALLCDGVKIGGVLHYALAACQRQQATLDLVLYGSARGQSEALRAPLQRRGIAHELILLGEESVEALTEYLCLRRTLIYLIAPADDHLARELTEQVIPSRGGRPQLPVVLVERNRHARITPLNAA